LSNLGHGGKGVWELQVAFAIKHRGFNSISAVALSSATVDKLFKHIASVHQLGSKQAHRVHGSAASVGVCVWLRAIDLEISAALWAKQGRINKCGGSVQKEIWGPTRRSKMKNQTTVFNICQLLKYRKCKEASQAYILSKVTLFVRVYSSAHF